MLKASLAQLNHFSSGDSVFTQTVPLCPKCSQASESKIETIDRPRKKAKLSQHSAEGEDDDSEDWRPQWHNKPLLKPDITFFGQALDDAFDKCLLTDREEADLLIIVGTSLQVSAG